MKTRAGFSIGAVLLTVFGAVAAAEPVVDEIVVTGKMPHSLQIARSDEMVVESKEVFSTATPVIALPKIQIEVPKLILEHG